MEWLTFFAIFQYFYFDALKEAADAFHNCVSSASEWLQSL